MMGVFSCVKWTERN